MPSLRRSAVVVVCLLIADCANDDAPQALAVPAPMWPVGARAALTGGTLAVSPAGDLAVAAVPDLDALARVKLDSVQVSDQVDLLQLGAGAQPGRLVFDADGAVHVALRGFGSVARVDVSGATMRVLETQPACAEPRGLAVDGSTLYVACAGGDLLTFATAGGPAQSRTFVEHDLRDVVVQNGAVRVTTFRSAELITVGGSNARQLLPGLQVPGSEFVSGTPRTFTGSVAWRMLTAPNGTAVLAYQRGLAGEITAVAPKGSGYVCPIFVPGYYGPPKIVPSECAQPPGQCQITVAGAVHSALAIVAPDGTVRSHTLAGALPIDVAVSPVDGSTVILLAGASSVTQLDLTLADERLFTFDDLGFSACSSQGFPQHEVLNGGSELIAAVAFAPNGDLLAQSEGALLRRRALDGAVLRYSFGDSLRAVIERDENGYQLFHRAPGTGAVACATCHPEALDDGRTWGLIEGTRRTQSLAGGAAAHGPFHWDGALSTMSDLMLEVFVGRMGGTLPAQQDIDSMVHWLGSRPAPQSDVAPLAAGKALFEGKAGCTQCHSGARFTNGALTDVGTGGAFKVPSLLGVSARLPLMHTGCAQTLEERFEPACGGDFHGNAADLSDAELKDLTAYLSSL